MIGFLIYEFFELCYYLTKLGYNGITSIYNWYYQSDNLTKDEIKNKINELKLKIKELEELSTKK